MFIPFKARIRDFIREQVKTEVINSIRPLQEAFLLSVKEDTSKNTKELTDNIQKVLNATVTTPLTTIPTCPVHLGYFTENYGPTFEGRCFEKTRVLANRFEALRYMPKKAVTAEIGVAFGEFTDRILEIMEPIEHHMIDLYVFDDFWNRGLMKKAGKKHYEYICDKYADKSEVKVDKGYSHEVMERFSDNYFDYVYVDGDHHYDGTKKDIAVLIHKVKDGGIIQFNDFTFFSVQGNYEFGVFRAVKEFLSGSKHEVLYYCLHESKMDDLVVQIHK